MNTQMRKKVDNSQPNIRLGIAMKTIPDKETPESDEQATLNLT
jgi:hypothetical protein